MKKVVFIVTVLAFAFALCLSSFAQTQYSLDALYVNENDYFEGVYSVYAPGTPERAGDAFSAEINITQGDKIYILGWIADNETSVDRIVYRIDGETEYECSDIYRDRTEIAGLPESMLPWIVDFEAKDFVKSGFGKDQDMMELIGIGDLAPGDYDLEIVGKFTNDEEYVIKSTFLNVEEKELTKRSFNADTDKQYFDKIYVNGEERADGNDAVAALKAGIDGSDGSVSTIGMFGWFGLVDTSVSFADVLDSFGYIIDDGTPVFDKAFAIETEQAVIDGNGLRYRITVDVSGLQDGKDHVIKACVKLNNDELVYFDRPDREAIINYKAYLPATPEPTEAPTDVPTDVPTDAPTDAPVETPTNAPEATPTEEPKNNGCGGFAFGGAALIALAAAALVIRKKH
ncbi:MAG: PT domain-containing protein [Clostridia bacterium]|nr:PT domain-containing protein [Clostridia bacterium]